MTVAVDARAFRLDDPDIQKDPYRFYPVLREQEPVLETDFQGQPCWVVSRRAEVETVLMNPAVFSSRTTPISNLLFTDPPDHTRLRLMVSALFTRGAVARMEDRIRSCAETLAQPLREAGEGDIVLDYAGPLTVAMIGLLLGIDVSQVEALRELTHLRASAIMAMRLGTTPSESAQRASDDLVALMRRLSRPGAHRPEGIIAVLAGLHAEGELSEEQFVAFAILLFAAGHTTTTNLIANAIYMLTQHPQYLARLQSDDAFIAPYLEETLRMRPSFHRLIRVTTQPCELGGVTIPAGAVVRLLLASANRDPAKFDRAETFDPDAERRAHISFGRGIHTCLGSWLARLEAGTALRTLVSQVSSLALDPARPPVLLSGGTFNEFGFTQLPVRIELRGCN